MAREVFCGFDGTLERSDRAELRAVIAGDKDKDRGGLSEWCRVRAPLHGQRGVVHAMQETVFGLSPAGNNDECFRVWEYLEYGVIPVVLERYNYVTAMKRALGIHGNGIGIGTCDGDSDDGDEQKRLPFLLLREWSDLRPALEVFRDQSNTAWNHTCIRQTQAHSQAMYRKYFKPHASQLMERLVDATRDKD